MTRALGWVFGLIGIGNGICVATGIMESHKYWEAVLWVFIGTYTIYAAYERPRR